MFLYLETPRAPQHIGHFAIYDPSTAVGGAVTFTGILRFLEERVHLAPAFRERLKEVPLRIDHPWWVQDADFDLEYHVRHIALPRPGDWRQLCIQVARIYSRPLDRARPLWEFTVVEGLNAVEGLPPGCFALVSKVHHAAVDGVSGTELTQAIHDLDPRAPAPTAGHAPPAPELTSLEITARGLMRNATQPTRLLRSMSRSLPNARTVLESADHRSRVLNLAGVVRTRFNGPVSPHRVVEGRCFDLAAIRAIKSAVDGATVNDVVLTICAGALLSYLDDYGETPDKALTLLAPISVRSEADRGAAGNRVSMMFVHIDPRHRNPMQLLHDVHEESVGSKEFANALGADLLTEYSQYVQGNVAALASRLLSRIQLGIRTPPRGNTVVTNVPGPQVPLYFMGAQLVRLFGLGPLTDGLGLFHTVFSYNGTITITITSDREMMKDPEHYADCIQRSFEALQQAVTKPRRKPRR